MIKSQCKNLGTRSNGYGAFVHKVLSKIVQVKPHIHRVELFLKTGQIDVLSHNLMAFAPKKAEIKDPTYREVKYFNLRGVKFSLNWWSESNYPDFRIKAVNPTPEALMELNRRVPDLVVSYVEYAVDFVCKESRDVLGVHWLLRRYLWFPGHTGAGTCAGSPFLGVDDHRAENSVSYFWNAGKKPNAVKIYERGPDALKRMKEDGKPWWHMDDVDRVRLEFILTDERGKYHLKKYGVRNLEGFFLCPRMEAILGGKFKFCVFEGHGDYPQEWGSYCEVDDCGGIDSFHLERLAAERRGVNINVACVEAASMAPLSRVIKAKLRRFDEEWRQAVMDVYERRFG
ncbi:MULTISPECIES: hypothetical protein [unclassified Pseudodesulfovibrio]|uniref:hypothetical protein n=1 Tax=unclassified Pseudodesulfovibrio TaxID=2661612 RepID=UPI000FEBBA1C|nr:MULTISPECIES: hypothetical protein [unclassified Pseudodesulfovibrio]MCJ2164693.1 hypothetical protein [Pseudodesulfovibrio sp. S3-i]RWU04115.1 hypothetical protein DWB63_08905 [Pseudodesulfovibrio sp. S3]